MDEVKGRAARVKNSESVGLESEKMVVGDAGPRTEKHATLAHR